MNSVRNLSGEGISVSGMLAKQFIGWPLFLNAGSWRELHEYLSKSLDVLMRNSENLDNVLDTLDLQQHSLGVLAIYMVKFMILNQNAGQAQGVTDPDHLITQVAQFFTVCNGEQIRFAPDSCMYRQSILLPMV